LVDPDTEGHLINRVASVNPAVGTGLNPTDTVTVRIGVAGAKVPNVSNPCMTPANAQTAIQGVGLIYFLEPDEDLTLPVGDSCNGKIIEQSPAAFSITGSLVSANSTVRVRVGRAMVNVPNLVGKTETEARTTIEDLELIPDVSCTTSGTEPGHVYAQSPAYGESPVQIRTEVTIQITYGGGSPSCPL